MTPHTFLRKPFLFGVSPSSLSSVKLSPSLSSKTCPAPARRHATGHEHELSQQPDRKNLDFCSLAFPWLHLSHTRAAYPDPCCHLKPEHKHFTLWPNPLFCSLSTSPRWHCLARSLVNVPKNANPTESQISLLSRGMFYFYFSFHIWNLLC